LWNYKHTRVSPVPFDLCIISVSLDWHQNLRDVTWDSASHRQFWFIATSSTGTPLCFTQSSI
jgi:hypothetical protein